MIGTETLVMIETEILMMVEIVITTERTFYTDNLVHTTTNQPEAELFDQN